MTIAVLGARCSLVVLVLCVCICVLYVVCVFHDRHLPPWQPRADDDDDEELMKYIG